jgi:hypothetical protein
MLQAPPTSPAARQAATVILSHMGMRAGKSKPDQGDGARQRVYYNYLILNNIF